MKSIVAARNQIFVMHSSESEDGTVRWFRGELGLHHIDCNFSSVLNNIKANTEIISIDCISGKEDRYFPPILGVTIYKVFSFLFVAYLHQRNEFKQLLF